MTHPAPNPPPPHAVLDYRGGALLLIVTLTLFVIRSTGPSNLLDNDQERPAAYVMDVVLHGNWACQTDWTGDIMSKPPLFTWIAALATLPVGHANLVSLYVPCLVAFMITVSLVYVCGRKPFGWAAGFLAGLMYLATPSGVKHIALARTDALFAATIALTAFMGYRAWRTGRGWSWFWLSAALATLTKGPLGILLASTGLMAIVWERCSTTNELPSHDAATSNRRAKPGIRWTAAAVGHLVGLIVFVMIAGGWFWLAYRHSGQAFVDKVIGRELVGHMVGDTHGTFGVGFVKAPLYWLSRFLPWSLLSVIGLWRVMAHPSRDPEERRFERFLFCWIVAGLFLFALARHQRGDLPLPLNAPAALLAGREVARWFRGWESGRVIRRSLTLTGAALAAYTLYLYTGFAGTWEVRQSEGIASFAATFRRDVSLPRRLLHVDSPYALQFHLNTMEQSVSFETAAAELLSDEPCAVAVQDQARLNALLDEQQKLHRIGSCPASREGETIVLVSNHPD